jgi:hypothetical protein
MPAVHLISEYFREPVLADARPPGGASVAGAERAGAPRAQAG